MPQRLPARSFYIISLALSLVLVFQPYKSIPYLLPPLLFVLALLWGRVNGGRFLGVVCTLYIISSISIVIDILAGREVSWPGFALSFITYFLWYFMLAFKTEGKIDKRTNDIIIRLICLSIFIQFPLNLFQANTGADFVSGFIGLIDLLDYSPRGSQTYYTLNLFIFILYLFPYRRNPWVFTALFMAVISSALAQSGHQTIFFLAALALSFMKFRFSHLTGAMALIVVFLVILNYVFPSIISTGYSHYVYFFSGDSPKYRILVDSAAVLAEGKNVLFGTGLGQYSSRASVIAAGFIRGGDFMPDAFLAWSHYFTNVVSPWVYYDALRVSSAMTRPIFSLLSIVVELGVPLTLLLIGVAAPKVKFVLKAMNNKNKEVSILARCTLVGMLFYVFSLFGENYAEIPQASTLTVLLFLFSIERIAYCLKHESLGAVAVAQQTDTGFEGLSKTHAWRQS